MGSLITPPCTEVGLGFYVSEALGGVRVTFVMQIVLATYIRGT